MRWMAVLWTFRRPVMGRPVPRQLLRNALLDLITIVPATAFHRRSYTERYSRFIPNNLTMPYHPQSKVAVPTMVCRVTRPK